MQYDTELTQRQPKFEVEKLTGTYKTTKYQYSEHTGLVPREVELPRGYMVYFPKGHSIHVSEQELIRMGYHRAPSIVDLKLGETVPNSAGELPVNHVPLKEQVGRMNKPRMRQVTEESE